MLQIFPGLCPSKPEQATLLGSPTDGKEGMVDCIVEKTRALEIIGDRLRCMCALDPFCLLCHAFAHLKVQGIVHLWTVSLMIFSGLLGQNNCQH